MRDQDMERRLLNWGRWRVAGACGTMGFAGVNWGKLGDCDGGRDGYVSASVPLLGIEASETDAVVKRLAPALRETLVVEYTSNLPLSDKLVRLGVVKGAWYARIERAHRAVTQALTELAVERQDARRRVELVSQSARAKSF